jgi:hypothetical protein
VQGFSTSEIDTTRQRPSQVYDAYLRRHKTTIRSTGNLSGIFRANGQVCEFRTASGDSDDESRNRADDRGMLGRNRQRVRLSNGSGKVRDARAALVTAHHPGGYQRSSG